MLCKEGGKSDTAKRKIGLLDLGVSEVPVDEVTNEIPDSAEELGCWPVVEVKQLLHRVPTVDRLQAWEGKFLAMLRVIQTSKQVEGRVKLFPGPREFVLGN